MCVSNTVEVHQQLEKEESLQRFDIIQLLAGNSVVPKKVYRQANERIATVVADYQNRTFQDYLRGVAHNRVPKSREISSGEFQY